MSYTGMLIRLNGLKLSTLSLKYRRLRGDMIEVLKIAQCMIQTYVSSNLAYHSVSITSVRPSPRLLLETRLLSEPPDEHDII